MFGLGFGEIIVLSAIGLIVLGPKQMPQVARMLGRTIAELRKALRDVTASVSVDLTNELKPKAPEAKPFVVKELPPHPPRPDNFLDMVMNETEKPAASTAPAAAPAVPDPNKKEDT